MISILLSHNIFETFMDNHYHYFHKNFEYFFFSIKNETYEVIFEEHKKMVS